MQNEKGGHLVYANEQILQSDWSRVLLMRCILILIGYRLFKRLLLLLFFFSVLYRAFF